MSFSYDENDLSTDLNQTRLLIEDTDSSDPKFQDAEVNFFIAQASNVFEAAAIACRALQAKYAQYVSKSVGKLKIEAQQKFDHYKELGQIYMSTSKAKGSPTLYAGGISVSDKDTQEEDTDRVTPAFYRDMHDFEGTVSASSED